MGDDLLGAKLAGPDRRDELDPHRDLGGYLPAVGGQGFARRLAEAPAGVRVLPATHRERVVRGEHRVAADYFGHPKPPCPAPARHWKVARRILQQTPSWIPPPVPKTLPLPQLPAPSFRKSTPPPASAPTPLPLALLSSTRLSSEVTSRWIPAYAFWFAVLPEMTTPSALWRKIPLGVKPFALALVVLFATRIPALPAESSIRMPRLFSEAELSVTSTTVPGLSIPPT